MIFQNIYIPSRINETKSLVILQHFPHSHNNMKSFRYITKPIDKTKGWCCFYGVAQGRPSSGVIGGILFLSDNHWFKFVVGIGIEINNKV